MAEQTRSYRFQVGSVGRTRELRNRKLDQTGWVIVKSRGTYNRRQDSFVIEVYDRISKGLVDLYRSFRVLGAAPVS